MKYMNKSKNKKIIFGLIIFGMAFFFINKFFGIKVAPAYSAPNKADVEIIPFDDLVKSECQFWVDVEGAVLTPGVYCVKDGDMVQTAVRKAGGLNQKVVAYRWVQKNINLSCPLQPHQKIYIPFEDEIIKDTLRQEKKDSSSNELKSLSDKVKTIEINCADFNKNLTDIKRSCQATSTQCSSFQNNVESRGDQGDPEENGDNTNNQNDEDCVNINTASLEELDELQGIGSSTAQKIINARPFNEIEDLKNVGGIGESKFEAIKNEICL